MQFRFFLFISVLVFFSTGLSAQQKRADELKNRADTLYTNDEFALASNLFKEAIKIELNEQEPRAVFLGRCSESLGHCLFQEAKLHESFHAFDNALRYYRKARSQESVNRLIPEIAGMHAIVKRFDLDIEPETGLDRISIEVHFSVKEILESGEDSAVVLLDAGTYDGIFVGAKGEALGIYSEEYPDRGNRVLGRAEVIAATNNRAKAIVKLTNAYAPEGSIRNGDMIRLPARVRKMENISLIYDLSVMNIDFLTNAREPLYHFRQVVNSEDPELVNDILSIMKRDIIETAEMIRPMIPDNPSWDEPQEAGRFKGISLVDAMEKVTTADIFSFLRFVESFPGKYMGHSWKINETYATWIINGTPIGDKDLLDSLMASGSDQQFKELLETYYEDLEDGDFYTNWQVEAEMLADKGQFSEAFRINDVLFRIAEIKQDTDLLAWAWFLKAQILQDDSKYGEAISAYTEAKVNFESAGNTRGVSFSTNNIALQYINLNRYNEALQNYTQSYEVKLKRMRSDSSSLMKESIAITLEGMASAYYNLSQFDEALNMYALSNKYYRSANTLDGLKGQAGNFKWMGRIHKKLGEYEEAISYFREKERMHQEMGDRDGEADVLDDIAWLKYEIGEIHSAKEIYEKASQIKLELGDNDDAGFSMANVGQMYWTLGEYEKAIDAHKTGLQWRIEANNRAGMAYSWSKLGSIYGESGDPKAAIEYYNLALDIYQELGDDKELATLYQDMGTTHKRVKNYLQSEMYYRKALELFEKIGDRYEYAYTLTSLGSLYSDDRKHEQADSCFRLSLSIQHEIGDKPGSVYNYMNLGVVENYYTFDLEQAEEYYTMGYRVAQETNNPSQVAYCKAAIGRMYSNHGDRKGLEMLEEACLKYAEIGEKSKEIELLGDIGDHFFRQGELQTAEEYYGKALALAKESNDRNSMARIYTSQGTLVHMLGDFTRALEIEEKSFKISKEVENEWGMASSYINFGNIYNHLGEFEKAITYYNLADSIYRDLRYDLSRAAPINNIGSVLYWQGNYDTALEYFMKAHAIHVESGAYPEMIALLKTNIGEIYFEKDRYTESEEWLTKSLNITRKGGFHRQTSNTLVTLVKLSIEQEEYGDAAKYLQECKEILKLTAEKRIECRVNYLLGKLNYKQENFGNAKINLSKAAEIARETGSKKHLWEPLFTLSQVHKAENDLDSAIASLTEAIEVIEYLKNKVTGGEEAMKIFASGDAKVKTYELMVEMLLQKGMTEEALAYLERGNSENLKSKFKELEVTYADQAKNEALQKEKDLKKRVDIVSEEIQKELTKPVSQQNAGLLAKLEEIRTVAQSEYLSFVNQIIREQPTLRNHFSKSENPLHFRSQKRFIPEDVAVLLYLAAENDIYIFVGTCDSVFAKVVNMKKAKLEMKLYQLYSMLKNPGQINSETGTSPFVDLSRELYSVLISPVEEEIRGKERLAIIPNGMLYYLPFQVLIHPESADLHYLRDDFSIFYSNRLSYLTSPYLVGETDPKLLAIGNADETLPYAEVEVNQLKDIYPGSQVLLRSEATKEKVLNPPEEFNILHFATHGILDYNDFENSYLVLAANPVTGDDGRFRIDEIYGITNIDRYQMVTLSACETAVTMKMLEGWPITTASAFLEAGVPTVIASLWSVDDEATSILMEKFYDNLQHMDKLEALHQAQQYLASMDKYKHPFFWAPFLLVGYWR